MTSQPIFTIGHSNHTVGAFFALLKLHEMTVVADVRSSPFSRHNPQFNRPELKAALKAEGIGYVFLGRELGARSDNPADYEGNRVSYSRLASREAFRGAIDRIIKGGQEHRVALMCAEKEPLDCHRTILVAQALVERGMSIEHILADGSAEAHSVTLNRLITNTISPIDDLFDQDRNPLSDALRTREQQIAYVRRGEAA